jgi:hypothetical protein
LPLRPKDGRAPEVGVSKPFGRAPHASPRGRRCDAARGQGRCIRQGRQGRRDPPKPARPLIAFWMTKLLQGDWLYI